MQLLRVLNVITTMKKSLLFLLNGYLLFSSFGAFAQPINENFSNVPSLFTTGGWAQQNLSTPIGTNPNWVQGNVSVFPANSLPDTSYIAANFNSVAGAATISNWLFTPTRTFSNGDVISFYTRTSTGTYPDNLQLRLSLNGTSTNVGTTNASVGDFTTLLLEVNPTLTTTGYPIVWTQYTVTISGLASPTSGRLAFRYFVTNGGPNGINSDYIGVDNFVYTPVGTATPDLTVSQSGEYTLIPQNQAVNLPLSARINNTGTATCSNATLKVQVYQLPNTATPVQTYTSTPTSLAAGANSVITLGTYTPPSLGNYLFKYTTSGTGNTVNASDTFNYQFTVVPKVYARDNGTSVQGIGGSNTISVIIGNTFKINTQTILDSVLFFVYPGAAGLGDTLRVRIVNTNASGVPQNTSNLAYSAPRIMTVADTAGAVITLPINSLSGGSLILNPGTYFVGVEEYLTADNMGLQCSANIFTPNTVYANINNGAYSPLNTLLAGFNYTPIIRMVTCAPSTATATHTACGSFTWINGITYTSSNSTATYVIPNASGCDSIITLNLTITPLSNATFNYTSNTICTSGTNVTPVINATGTFSSAQSGLVFANSTTGEIDVTASQNGTYSVTFTTSGTCPNSSTQTITLTSSPSANFSYDNVSYCINSSNPQVIFGTGASAGTFTASPAGLALNAASGDIDLTSSLPNTYAVTNTIPAAGACPQATSTYTLVINDIPTVSFLIDDDTVCTEEPSIILAGGLPTGGMYSGSNVVGNVFTPSSTGTTILTYDYTDVNGCSNSATASIEVIGCASLDELSTESFITCYPNPTIGNVNIESEQSVINEVRCYNALGQLIFTKVVSHNNNVQIDMKHLAKGIYTLEVETNRCISMERIVLE